MPAVIVFLLLLLIFFAAFCQTANIKSLQICADLHCARLIFVSLVRQQFAAKSSHRFSLRLNPNCATIKVRKDRSCFETGFQKGT